MYEALKKAPPAEHREYGRRLTNGIRIYHDNIIPQAKKEVKNGGGTYQSSLCDDIGNCEVSNE